MSGRPGLEMKGQGLHSVPLIVPPPLPVHPGPRNLPGAYLISQQPAPQPPPRSWLSTGAPSAGLPGLRNPICPSLLHTWGRLQPAERQPGKLRGIIVSGQPSRVSTPRARRPPSTGPGVFISYIISHILPKRF